MSNRKSSKIPRVPSTFDARIFKEYHDVLRIYQKYYSLYFIKSDDEFCELSLTTLFGIPILYDDKHRDLYFRMLSNLYDVLENDSLHDDVYMEKPELDYSAIKLLDLPFVLVLKDKDLALSAHQKFIDYVSTFTKNKEQI